MPKRYNTLSALTSIYVLLFCTGYFSAPADIEYVGFLIDIFSERVTLLHLAREASL
jgi:hypothetical protein